MIKVTLITNAGKKNVIVPENKTLRQIYEENDVNYHATTNSVDSVPLQIGDLDKTLAQLGVGETCRMSSIVKMDNAAKIVIAGNAAVVKSEVKLDDWKKCLKFDDELGLYDEQDEPLFKVSVDECSPGSLTKYGAVFSGKADSEGFATITVLIDPGVEDVVAKVTDELGGPLLDLNQLEKTIPEVLKDAEDYEKEIKDSIVLM